MNKKLIISLSVIGVVAAIAIGGTIAYYNDTETSTGNTFTAGTLNLQVGGEDPTTWSYSTEDIKPGDEDKEFVTLQNTGSLDGYLHITFANLINDEMGCPEPEQNEGGDTTCGNPGPNEGELAENLDILIYLDENGNTNFELGTDTLIYQGKVKGILQGDLFNYFLSSGDSKKFRIEWELDSSVGNIVQSDKTGYDINFELTQNKQEEIVGDWHFDENGGTTAYDNSGFENNGTINGATWASGKYNPALSLDGSNDNVVVDDSDSLKPDKVTLEAWVKNSGTPGQYKYIAGKRYGGGWGSYHLYTGPSGGLKFYIGHNGGYIASPDAGTGIWDNSWHHITGTYDGSIVKLYVDGAEIPGGTGATQDIAYNTENFYIGSYGNGYYFSGLVDEVRVYSQDLSASEILARYQTGL
jgi:predicted ribosomally synthesized peptide with SipW-like signal peptide